MAAPPSTNPNAVVVQMAVPAKPVVVAAQPVTAIATAAPAGGYVQQVVLAPAAVPPPGAPPGGVWQQQSYCGPVSCCIGLFLFWPIVCCPVDDKSTAEETCKTRYS